jgi:hypothetical protein
MPNAAEIPVADVDSMAAQLKSAKDSLMTAVAVGSLAFSKWGFDETIAFETAYERAKSSDHFYVELLCARLKTQAQCAKQLAKGLAVDHENDEMGPNGQPLCVWDQNGANTHPGTGIAEPMCVPVSATGPPSLKAVTEEAGAFTSIPLFAR